MLFPAKRVAVLPRRFPAGMPMADGRAPAWWMDFVNRKHYYNRQFATAEQIIAALGGTSTRFSTGASFDPFGKLISNGSNVLRRDYDPVTLASKGILLEGARTNLGTYSEDFRNTPDAGETRPWTYLGVTLTPNATVAPDGATTADKMVEVAAANTPRIATSYITSSGAAYTYSIRLKAAERDQVRIVAEGSSSISAYYLLSGSGTVSVVGAFASATITQLAGGWYRCTLTWTTTTTTPSVYVATASGGAVIVSGDNTKGLYLWGSQLEAGSFASSYIPTTSASATRAADVLTLPTSPWFNESAGTLLFEFVPAYVAVTGIFSINNSGSATTNRIDHRMNTGSVITVAGVSQSAPLAPSVYESGVQSRICYAFSVGDTKIAKDSYLGTGATPSSLPVPNLLRVGDLDGGGAPSYWHLRRVCYWPFRVTDAELQRLSAPD